MIGTRQRNGLIHIWIYGVETQTKRCFVGISLSNITIDFGNWKQGTFEASSIRLLGFLSRHIYLLCLMKPSKKVSAATKEIMDVNGEKKQC
jgi:hypothetical protein